MHSLDVDYHKLLPSLFQINAGYFLIQLSSEKDREEIYRTIGQHIRKDAGGVKQVFAHVLYSASLAIVRMLIDQTRSLLLESLTLSIQELRRQKKLPII